MRSPDTTVIFIYIKYNGETNRTRKKKQLTAQKKLTHHDSIMVNDRI